MMAGVSVGEEQVVQLPEGARALFNGPNHVAVTTIDPDGSPQMSLVSDAGRGSHRDFMNGSS